jgi:hypothetical protein
MYTGNEWYQEVPALIKKVNDLYDQAVSSGKTYTKLSVTQQKIVEARNWSTALPVVQKNFDRALTQLDCFYVPKTVRPGPMIVFPLRDINGIFTRAQTKPFEGSTEYGPDHKYMYLGKKSKEFEGPCWIGNDTETLHQIVKQRRVLLVEGAFDLLACRLVAPDFPSLSPLTKSLGLEHQGYLRMLGVETLHLMFDHDQPKEDRDLGAGEISMRCLQRDIKTMNVDILFCPSSDPSKCLETYTKAGQLRTLLANL